MVRILVPKRILPVPASLSEGYRETNLSVEGPNSAWLTFRNILTMYAITDLKISVHMQPTLPVTALTRCFTSKVK